MYFIIKQLPTRSNKRI